MKTKGNWVIKTSAGGYWCGNAHFDPQLRKAQVYHWKEAAEDQIETIKRRKYMPAELEYEVVAISEPRELKDTDFGYEEGKRAMQVSEELKKELGNAIAAYGQILTKAFLRLSTPGFEHLMTCTEEELKHKMQMLKDFHNQL